MLLLYPLDAPPAVAARLPLLAARPPLPEPDNLPDLPDFAIFLDPSSSTDP